jgi:hypothetical protein
VGVEFMKKLAGVQQGFYLPKRALLHLSGIVLAGKRSGVAVRLMSLCFTSENAAATAPVLK